MRTVSLSAKRSNELERKLFEAGCRNITPTPVFSTDATETPTFHPQYTVPLSASAGFRSVRTPKLGEGAPEEARVEQPYESEPLRMVDGKEARSTVIEGRRLGDALPKLFGAPGVSFVSERVGDDLRSDPGLVLKSVEEFKLSFSEGAKSTYSELSLWINAPIRTRTLVTRPRDYCVFVAVSRRVLNKRAGGGEGAEAQFEDRQDPKQRSIEIRYVGSSANDMMAHDPLDDGAGIRLNALDVLLDHEIRGGALHYEAVDAVVMIEKRAFAESVAPLPLPEPMGGFKLQGFVASRFPDTDGITDAGRAQLVRLYQYIAGRHSAIYGEDDVELYPVRTYRDIWVLSETMVSQHSVSASQHPKDRRIANPYRSGVWNRLMLESLIGSELPTLRKAPHPMSPPTDETAPPKPPGFGILESSYALQLETPAEGSEDSAAPSSA